MTANTSTLSPLIQAKERALLTATASPKRAPLPTLTAFPNAPKPSSSNRVMETL